MLRADAALLLLCSASALHCGSAARYTPRTFARAELSTVPLKTITLVTVAAEPVKLTSARLDAAQPFPPPRFDTELTEGRPTEPRIAAPLYAASAAVLKARGFEVIPAPDGAKTLTDIAAVAETDGILVLRAVPMAQLYVLDDDEVTQVLDAGGTLENGAALPQGDSVARLTPGVLFMGQAFLYDRATGVRLWSEQLPDMPRDRALRQGSPMLRYGVIGADFERLEVKERVPAAARGAARALLTALPSPQEGSPDGTQALAGVDVRAERRREAFFDRPHLGLEIGAAWSFEQASGNATLPDGTQLPSLGNGELGPLGALSPHFRLTWVTAGGTSFGATAVLGTVPGASFSRRVFRGGDTPAAGDELGVQSLESTFLFGGGLGIGRLLAASNTVFLHPFAGLFAEQWSYDATPGFLDPVNQIRLGTELRFDVLWLPTPTPFMLRGGVHGRAGIADGSRSFFGGGLSLGAGVLF